MITLKRKISFYDCDPAGIIFYSRIFEFCHSTYEKMIANFDLKEDYWSNDEYVVPIIHTQAEYLKPIKYGDEIEIKLQVTQLKNSSFELSYNLLNGEILCGTGKTVHIVLDKNSWEKIEIPTDIKNGLSSHLK